MMTEPKIVTIYTDGACIGNPGPGGYGVVLVYNDSRTELSGGFRKTTNNRMEIMAAIAGLEALKERCQVILYSDSKYLVNAMTESWAKRWQAQGWKRNRKERALNPDLWARLLRADEAHQVEFRWIKGHNATFENERCDRLANEAANRLDLPTDEGYENSLKDSLLL